MKGSISISRVVSSDEDDFIKVEIVDELSGVHFCQAKLSMLDFALAITGRGDVACDLDLRGLELVGMKREQKTVVVEVDHDHWRDAKSTRLALKKHEKDGWKGRNADIGNYHNRESSARAGMVAFRVQFTRHVKP